MINHDFATEWHKLTAADPNHRGEAAVDLAFWQAHAAGYDVDASSAEKYTATLAAIQPHLRPNDTLLDMGAGTGRFALPLARSVRQVTALDHAAPMLAILRRKLHAQCVNNIVIQQADWDCPTTVVPQHDVVLAAWSLYRVRDILASMQKLIAATRRTLIIVASPGRAPNDTPLHLYFYGALWQAGVFPDIQIVWEAQKNPVALLVWQRREIT